MTEHIDEIALELQYDDMNSHELISHYIETVEILEAMADSHPTEERLVAEWEVEYDLYQTRLKLIQQSIKSKVNNVDKFMLTLQKREYLLDAELEHLKSEQQRIKKRQNALKSTNKYFNSYLLPMFIKTLGKDNVWETDIARYKLYQDYGPVIVDPHLVSKDFEKVQIVKKIDRVKARKAAINASKANKQMPPGITIEKVNKVRRS